MHNETANLIFKTKEQKNKSNLNKVKESNCQEMELSHGLHATVCVVQAVVYEKRFFITRLYHPKISKINFDISPFLIIAIL